MDGTTLELPLFLLATFAGALVAGLSGFAFGLVVSAIWLYILTPLQTATVGLGIGAFLVALVVLLGNLWLAGRLAPPPSAGGGTFRSLFDRLNEAAQAADYRRDSTRSPFGGGRDPFGNVRSTGSPIVFETTDMPDLTPLAGWILGGLALFFALIIGGSVSGAWETVLLWIHRVPFSPTASVTDPIFDRDIGFFLFELPFLRLVQGAVQRHRRRRAAPVAGALPRRRVARRARLHRRRSASTSRSSAACSCCRSRSATSSTSSSCRTAPAASRPASASPTRTRSSSPSTC